MNKSLLSKRIYRFQTFTFSPACPPNESRRVIGENQRGVYKNGYTPCPERSRWNSFIRIIPAGVILFTGFLFANTPTVEAIQDSLISRFSRIEDYSVNIKISVKMTGLRMPRKKIKLYYKAPDKIKVKSRGFAIVPKTGLGGSPVKFLNMLESINVAGDAMLNNRNQWLLTGTVIPDSMDIPIDSDNIPNIIMNLWVDSELWAITKAETIIDSQKVFQLVSDYAEVDGIFLPSKTTLSLGFKGLKNWTMHEPFGGPMSDRKDFEKVAKEAGIDPDEKEFAGTVVMEFSKYKVNRGLDDKLFKD